MSGFRNSSCLQQVGLLVESRTCGFVSFLQMDVYMTAPILSSERSNLHHHHPRKVLSIVFVSLVFLPPSTAAGVYVCVCICVRHQGLLFTAGLGPLFLHPPRMGVLHAPQHGGPQTPGDQVISSIVLKTAPCISPVLSPQH